MRFILPKLLNKEDQIRRIMLHLSLLDQDKAWMVKVDEYKATRTNQQNRYLFGVCYPELLKHLPGWEAEDVHEYFLGEHFGWETLSGLGRKKVRPLKRSSRLTTTEFADHVEFIQRKAAEMGVIIPDPE